MLSNIYVHRVLAFYSKNAGIHATLHDISTHGDLALDRVSVVVARLVSANILIQTESTYYLNRRQYEKLLSETLAYYEPMLEALNTIKDRTHHIALDHEIESGEKNLAKPILYIETISEDHRYIKNAFASIPELRLEVYTTSQLMNMLDEKDARIQNFKSGIVLK